MAKNTKTAADERLSDGRFHRPPFINSEVKVQLQEVGGEKILDALEAYEDIPIAFEVSSVFEVSGSNGEFHLAEYPPESRYVKDYDAIRGKTLRTFLQRFDLTNWRLFTASIQGQRVGGAVAVFNTKGVIMLENRSDLAVLWDIRVSPKARQQGVGSTLFRSVEEWAKTLGCRQLKVETQNINVPACKFYARQGCTLGAVHHRAYDELPEEIQLFWYKNLCAGTER